MIEHGADGISVGAAIVEIRLAEKAASVEIRADRMATASGYAIAVKMIEDHRQVGRITRTPCQTAHDELFIIA